MNKDKCAVLRFQRGSVDWQQIGTLAKYYLQGQEISMVSSHKDVGVLVDSTLRFHLHVR